MCLMLFCPCVAEFHLTQWTSTPRFSCYFHLSFDAVCSCRTTTECSIKLLQDRRGFVCASDDGVLSAVASLEAGSESDIRRATFALHGHSGFVTDCDTAPSGHAVLSSRYILMMECFDCVSCWLR